VASASAAQRAARRIDAWERLPPEAVEAGAAALPIPGIARQIEVVWNA
jgi:hypothetical protein